YKRRFEEDAMVLIRQLGYPLADTINRKELLSIGAMHSNPTFIALLHWLVVVCKIMDTPRLSDDEVDEEIDEEAVAQLLHAYAIAGYHKYMTGDDDMASLDQELEHIFERANQPNLHQIEIYTKSISALEQELAQLESDNGELDTLKERHGVLVKDIGKFKAYIEEKVKKVSKYKNMVERAGEEKKRLEHQLENLNQQIQASRDKLAEKNISEEELVAMYQKTKALEKEYAELERTAEESRQKQKGVSEYNQKARTVDLSVLEGENILIEYNPLGKTLKEKTSIDIEEQLLITDSLFKPTLEGLERSVTDETAKLLSQTAILRQELDSIKLENSHLREEIKQQEERVENLKRLYKENHAIFFQEIGKFNKMKDDTVQGWNAKRSIMRKELLDLQDEVRVLEQKLEETNENYRKKRQETERRLQPVLKKVELFFDQASTIADEHHQALKKLHQDICEAFI
ncbi:kinetochore-associated Ndc80 complex subunit ndc80, partial [Rhizopus stolonifer]